MVASTKRDEAQRSELSAGEFAYFQLREQILDGKYAAGDHLAELTLAAEIGVSRTPVRAALQRLESDGLVEFKRNQGAVVRALPEEEVDQIFALRAHLESFAAGLVAERITAEELDALRALCSRMEAEAAKKDADVTYIAEINKQFHRSIIHLSGNVYLARFAANLVDLNFILRSYNRFNRRDLERSMAHHRELTEAFAAGNADWARGVMTAHVHVGRVIAQRAVARKEAGLPEQNGKANGRGGSSGNGKARR
ncbi:MAG: GntR family transcriptional regulator [Rhodovibrionaceae bacterium]